MQKYLKIFFNLFRYNLIHEMEFRKNFFIRLFTQILFVGIQILIVSTFFNFTSSLGTWSKSDVFVLVGIFRLIEGAFHMFFHSNILYLPELVNSGELDLLLSKPVNNLFLISLKKHQLYEISTFLSGVVILVYSGIAGSLTWLNIIFLATLGLISLYSIMLFFSTLSFFVPRMSALSSIWDVVSKTSRFPLDILTGPSRVGTSIAAPLILIATLPAQIVLAKGTPLLLIMEILGTIVVFTLAYRFWSHSLQRYSSASS